MSWGSFVDCIGSDLLGCCFGYIDSFRVGGRGCRCGVFLGGFDDVFYCLGFSS